MREQNVSGPSWRHCFFFQHKSVKINKFFCRTTARKTSCFSFCFIILTVVVQSIYPRILKAVSWTSAPVREILFEEKSISKGRLLDSIYFLNKNYSSYREVFSQHQRSFEISRDWLHVKMLKLGDKRMNIGYVFNNISGCRKALGTIESAFESPDSVFYNDKIIAK